jgi:O-antigen/teichoic acid export membrane protein
MHLKYRIISGTIWNAINSSATFFIGIGTVAVLARLLKPEDFGLFAMITVALNILDSFSDMGVSGAIISYRDIEDHELNSLFYFNILLGVILTLLLIAASPIVVHYYKEPKIYIYLWILASNFTITSPGIMFNLLMKKHMQFKYLSEINIVSSIVYAVVVIGYAFIHRSIMSLVVGMLVQSVVSTALLIRFGSKIWKPGKPSIRYKYLKRFLSFGLFQMGERIINRFNRSIDYLLIGRFLGAEALGFYSVAYELMLKPIRKINPIITSVAFPALSEIQEDRAQLKRYFLKMTRYVCYVMAPIFLIFFSFSEGIVLILYGPQWYRSVPILAIFSFLGIMYAIGNPMGNLILALGRADIGFYSNLFQTVFLFIANYIGVQFGIEGVAFSTLIVSLGLFFPVSFLIRYYLIKMGVREYLEQLYKPVFFSLTAAGSILLLRRHVTPLLSLTLLYRLALLGCVFMAVYILLLLLLDKKEMIFLRGTLKEFFKQRNKHNKSNKNK